MTTRHLAEDKLTMSTTFDEHDFAALLDRHGSEVANWAAENRAHARELLESSAEARQLLAEARLLDETLDELLPGAAVPLGLGTRIVANAPHRDPWLQWLAVRLWRPAALACLPLAVGFAVGNTFADDAADLEDQVLVAFADADTFEAFALPEEE